MKVLVLMAVYNGAKYIKEQIQSIFAQEGVDVHLIIADDSSTDDSVEIIKGFILNGAPIELVTREEGTGSAAKNFMSLIKLAKDYSKYDAFSFSDQDDIWLPAKLKSATDMLSRHNAALYMSNLIMWDEVSGDKTILRRDARLKKFDYLFESGSAGCTYVLGKDFFSLLREQAFKISYHNWKGFSHDWLIYFLARINACKVVIDPVPNILYRIHANNVHGHLNKSSISSFRAKLKLVQNGWYLGQIEGFLPLIDRDGTERKIYNLYKKGILFRLFVLVRYNFGLIRNPTKLIQFGFVSLLPQKNI
ncbi:glycosyltransferase [Pedobacter sp. P26]|uniref:glycosyltransferase n=1 Tax=Pedobacter sp. P26 TaxID=3423956 RepID=UPI003D667CA5